MAQAKKSGRHRQKGADLEDLRKHLNLYGADVMTLFLQGQICLAIAYLFPDLQVGMLIIALLAFLVYFFIEYQLMCIKLAVDMIKNDWDGYSRLRSWGYWD